MKLSYKTRGNSDPRGKAQVYYSAHPEDSGAYRDLIINEILARQNCAVYFDTEPGKPCSREELESLLSEMKLFVFAVTSRFLYSPNQAREVELPFALKAHIPVLPLLEEPGLSSEFDRVCGALQTLSRHVRDDTAIPYGEKLTNYLSSVLVGEELAQKVRAAFDAYIFLSYRKKDRKYAQELMRLIHRNPLCRDIAIWYDEFLVPGEDFNGAIADALKNSDLFALAVTPNLLEPGNYVLHTEYPAAVKGGRPVLPAEMVPTERKKLRKAYPGLPDCVRGEEISRTLLKTLHGVATRERPDDPEHSFFIGLAYLSGIDVEVNHEMALRLIRGAAEQDLPEAVSKLSDMYSAGQGVERDHRESAKWRRQLVGIRRREYEKNRTPEAAEAYSKALAGLGEFLYELQDPAGAAQAFEELREFSEKTGDRRILAYCCSYLGNICRDRYDYAAARSYYEQSLKIEEERAAKEGTAGTQRGTAVMLEKLGNLCERLGDFAAARDYYGRSLKIFERIAAKTGKTEDRQSLSTSYSVNGGLYKEKGDLETARTYYEKSVKIHEEVAAETQLYADYSKLSSGYINMVDLCLRKGSIPEAMLFATKALKIAEQLTAQSGTPKAYRELAVTCEKQGDIFLQIRNYPEARKNYEKCLGIREKIAAETGTAEIRWELAISYEKLGYLNVEEKKLPAARGFFEKSVGIARGLVSQAETVYALRSLSIGYGNLGSICAEEGDRRAARTYYEKSLEIFEKLAKQLNTPRARLDLSINYEKLGYTCRSLGDPVAARSYYEKMMAIDEGLLTGEGTAEEWNHLAQGSYDLGKLCEELGDIPAACSWYEKHQQMCGKLAAKTGTPQSRANLQHSMELLSACRQKMRAQKLKNLFFGKK